MLLLARLDAAAAEAASSQRSDAAACTYQEGYALLASAL
jgi:hypothetical protein